MDEYAVAMISGTFMNANSSYETFCDIIGSHNFEYHEAKSSFSPEKKCLWCPPIYTEMEKVAMIASTCRLNPRPVTLVISLNNSFNMEVKSRLQRRLPKSDHVDVGTLAFDQLVRSPVERLKPTVVYGSKTLITGVDLPGKVGLVVILKPLNFPYTCVEKWDADWMEGAAKVKEVFDWRGCIRFRQACGRLNRIESDEGVVLFFEGKSGSKTLQTIVKQSMSSNQLVTDPARMTVWPYPS